MTWLCRIICWATSAFQGGGHEYEVRRARTRVWLECARCGRQTSGFSLETTAKVRRKYPVADRRFALVKPEDELEGTER